MGNLWIVKKSFDLMNLNIDFSCGASSPWVVVYCGSPVVVSPVVVVIRRKIAGARNCISELPKCTFLVQIITAHLFDLITK